MASNGPSSNVLVGLVVLVVLALAGGLFLASGSDDEEASSTAANTSSPTATTTSSSEPSEIAVASSGASSIQEYSEAALAASETEDNLVFFHAKWCTVCESVRRNVEAGSIPDSLSIFQVDYDSAEGQALAEKYQIGPQFTMVQVNTDGTEIQQWVNQFGDGVDEIVGNLI